ncbi:MAG: type VI secretion system Vgr family protein, partial [Gammaproteobacteria bacterium]
DFNFVSRLMEQEGIYYFFKHEDGKHTLVLADSLSAHEPFASYTNIEYRPESKGAKDREIITDWVLTKEVQPGIYVLKDFDAAKPNNQLLANAKLVADHAAADFEIYDYPGEYVQRKDGEEYARMRIEELHAKHEVARGQATSGGVCAGSTFSLEDYPRKDQNREYLVTGTSQHFEIGEFESGGAAQTPEFCTCTFTAIPSRVPFRSTRSTPKPSIQGVQTAIVVGPKGDEIHTDEHARVKVQFHWDRYGKNDENSSCWVRVSQANAGKSWGSMITPRIGQEVIVEFLEGDPDRPIITGRVYNGEQKPPFADGQGVVSGTKSQTHKGGGYNEFTMDDTAGKEKITIHGQYDMVSTVEHDQTSTINNKFNETIKSDATIKVSEGKYSLQTSASEIVFDGATKITLKSGASKITLETSGDIKIEGVNVTISGTASVKTKGALVSSEAQATNTIKGGMVMVN